MEFSQTVSYIWMQQAFLALFMMWFSESSISEAITTGAIAYELVRPMDLYNRWFCQSAGNRMAIATLRCIPIFLVVFILPQPYRMVLPPSLTQVGLFLLSMPLAMGVSIAALVLLYISMFYTFHNKGAITIIAVTSDFLSGSHIPIPFFPEPVRKIVELLPFAAMQNVPLRIYSGDLAGGAALQSIALQVFWLVALILIGRLCMRRALKKVVVQGG